MGCYKILLYAEISYFIRDNQQETKVIYLYLNVISRDPQRLYVRQYINIYILIFEDIVRPFLKI